ncbi:MAG: L-threonylcarbamoyladenylate synthase [Patescibacteria group bacterium]
MNQKEQVKHAVEILKKGGVVVFPTETAYGICADATNEDAVAKISIIKQRRQGNTFPLIVGTLKMAQAYGDFSQLMKKMAREFWPGALTLCVPIKKEVVLSKYAIKNGSIALRVSSNEIARLLSKELGVPIISTSANLSGKESCYSVEDVKKEFVHEKLQPDYFIDAGVLPKRKSSTIVQEQNGKLDVLREGSVRITKKYVA